MPEYPHDDRGEIPFDDHVHCEWCEGWMREKSPNGKRKRFCSSDCKAECEAAERLYIRVMRSMGLLTTETLKALCRTAGGQEEGK